MEFIGGKGLPIYSPRPNLPLPPPQPPQPPQLPYPPNKPLPPTPVQIADSSKHTIELRGGLLYKIAKDHPDSDTTTEAQIQIAIQHPAIPKVHKYTNRVIVMDYIPFPDLWDLIYQKGYQFTENVAYKIIKDLVSIVYHIYECGYYYRDVKAENILFDTRTLRVFLVDFGFTKPINADAALGTPPYIAPEMYRHLPHKTSDVYSIGVLWYELLHHTAAVKFFRCSKKTRMWIQGCLHPDPQKRTTLKYLFHRL